MSNPYHLQFAKIIKIEESAKDIRLFTFDFAFKNFTPGQFLMLSIPGLGEAPFGIMQTSENEPKLKLSVRKVGNLTTKLFELKPGDKVYLRGPYGNGFPIHNWKKKNLVLVAGGTGIVPIKALLDYTKNHQNEFGEIQLLYGAKTPDEILFKKELESFQKFSEIMLTVEKAPTNWHGNTGLITCLITPTTISPDNSIAVLCGPPLMYKFVIEKLKKIGFEDKNIFVSLERRIRCGVGKCQHCTCKNKYVCLDGPVFNYVEALKFSEGL